MKRMRVVNVVLLLLIAVVVWKTVEVWRRGVPDAQARADAGRGTGDSLPPAARKPALPQMVALIAEKDLFDVSRKAPEAVAPTAEKTPVPPPTLKLAGVLVVGDEREAVLTDTAQNNKQIRMRVGEDISGYRVSKITTDEVSMVSSSGEEVTLQLEIDKTKASAKKGFGPGGKPPVKPVQPGQQPKPGQAPAQVAGQAAPGQAQPPAQLYPGAFGPPGIGGVQPPPTANDAKRRADAARERLKRLRAENGGR
jgi:hypothetical protein